VAARGVLVGGYSQRRMSLEAGLGATGMSALEEYSVEPAANFLQGPILRGAGTHSASSEDIMALALRVALWIVVLLAPGGLLLLPFLALNELKGSHKSDTAGAH